MNSFISLVFTIIIGVVFALFFMIFGFESAKGSFSKKGSFQYQERKYSVMLIEEKQWIKVKEDDNKENR